MAGVALISESASLSPQVFLAPTDTCFREAFDTSPIPMWIYDLESLRFADVNHAAIGSYGYSRAEFLSMSIRDIRPQEDVAQLTRSVKEHSHSVASYSAGIWRHRKKDGTVFSVEIIAHPIMHNGRAAEMIFALDVDARVRAEAETNERSRLAVLVAESASALASAESLRGGLQQCAELLNRYIEAIFVRIWTFDEKSGQLELHASAGALTTLDDRYSRIPIECPGIGTIAAGRTPMIDNQILTSGWIDDPERARRMNLVAFIGYPLVVEDRTVGVAAAFAAHPLTDAAVQAFQSVAGGMSQFIERKHAEGSVNNLAALVEHSSDAIVMATLEGQITFVNNAALQLLGFASEMAAKDLNISQLHMPGAWETIQREVIPKTAGASHWCGESQLRHQRTGEPIDVLMSAFLVRDSNGTPVSKAAVIHDIRDRKQVEDALRRAKASAESASRLKSEFLANMSHEIRTPMNGIIGMTDLALDTELTGEQRDYLETAKSSANSLLQVIDDILDFSRIESGRLELEIGDFEIRELIRDAVNLMMPSATEKWLALTAEIAPEIPHVLRGDPTRLRQVMTNLIGNAIKFTNAGHVVLRARIEEGAGKLVRNQHVLHFAVEDTGIGIPADKQESIFDAFSQVDGSASRKFGGTGLGLSISARLIEMMGGRIWVESELGKGSTFHFTLTL